MTTSTAQTKPAPETHLQRTLTAALNDPKTDSAASRSTRNSVETWPSPFGLYGWQLSNWQSKRKTVVRQKLSIVIEVP